MSVGRLNCSARKKYWQITMPTIWNADRVSTLTDAELTILLTNARSRQNELVSSLCIDEIHRRKIIAKEARQVSNGKRSGNAIRPRYRNIEIDADNCFVPFAHLTLTTQSGTCSVFP